MLSNSRPNWFSVFFLIIFSGNSISKYNKLAIKCLGKSIITTLFSGDNQVSNNWISYIFREEIYSQYRSFSHIGIVIDACTVNSFHFIDFCLTIPSAKDSFNGKPLVIPFNYKTCFIKSASVENIQREVINSIIDLRTKGLNITSVTADNIPTQVLALAQWSKHSIMRSD